MAHLNDREGNSELSSERKLSRLRRAFQSITLEPMILMQIGSYGIVNGVEIQTNLKLWKVCHIIFNHTEEVCEDLSAHGEIQEDVQKYVNNFDMWGNLLSNVPGLLYCIFAGALSDK